MPTFLPNYTHIVNPKLKHTYLSFDDEGHLIIKSPKLPQKQIEQLLLQKAGWIRRSMQKIAQKKGRKPEFTGETKLYYLGDAYPLKIDQHTKKRVHLSFDQTHFLLHYSTFDTEVFQKHIDRFYKTEAERFIPPLVSKWAEKMALTPSHVKFRKTKRQWGSCSSRNVLSFNTTLMKLPQEVIEYVIVHELSHIQHKHHQRPFWQLVEATMPDYKEHIATLKTYSPN